jgi:hypothetical protein
VLAAPATTRPPRGALQNALKALAAEGVRSEDHDPSEPPQTYGVRGGRFDEVVLSGVESVIEIWFVLKEGLHKSALDVLDGLTR